MEQQLDGLLLDRFDHGVVHLVAFALVFDQRIALAHATQPDTILEIIHLIQVFTPLAVKNREHDTTFQLAQTLFTKLAFEVDILVLGVGNDKLLQGHDGLVSLELGDSILGCFRFDGNRVHGVQSLEQAFPIPILRLVRALVGALDVAQYRIVDELEDILVDVLALQYGLTLGIDDGALLVHHIVVLEHVLTDFEVARFHGLLRGAHALGNALRLDRLAFRHALGHNASHELRVEQTHQIVFERQIETGLARIALTSGTATQLIVDTAGLVTLGTKHVQTAELDDLFMLVLDLLLDFGQGARPTLFILVRSVIRRVAFGLKLRIGEEFDVAAEHDIGTTACHVGSHGDGALTACDGHDGGFLVMLLRVQHLVRNVGNVKQGRHDFRGFHGSGTQQHRLTLLVALGHITHDGGQLLLLGTENQIVLVFANHRLVGRNREHAQLVGAHELRGLGFCGTGHARQLVVHTEVVLQGNGGEGLVLSLDFHVFLGFDGLMQALIVATTRQDTAGVFVDDEHLAAGHHVIAVAQEQFLGLDGVVQVADQRGVVRLVQVVDAEIILDLVDAWIKNADNLLFLVDLIILVAGELEHQTCELAVPTGHVAFGRTGNDQRGTGLVDEDGVDLIDDGEVVAALHQIGLFPRHVVAQVVETELVVGAVGDVGVVLLAALRRLLVGDDAAGAHAKEAVDTAHEFGLIACQIVVDGDDMHALAVKRVQVCRQGCHKGLAFTGLHFGDVAPVQCRTAHELHVEVTQTQGALGRLTHGGEGFRHQLVERFAVVETLLELGGLSLKLLVVERCDLVLQRVGCLSDVLKLLDLSAFAHSQGFVNDIYHNHSLCVCELPRPRLVAV